MLLGDWYEEEGGRNGWSDTVWVRHWLGVVSIGDMDTGAVCVAGLTLRRIRLVTQAC